MSLTKSLQVLLRDATTLLLHFSLILPVQIDRVFFTTIVRQVDNNIICAVVFHIICRLALKQLSNLHLSRFTTFAGSKHACAWLADFLHITELPSGSFTS